MDKFTFGGNIVWKPSKDYIERSNLKKFMDLHGIGSFDELMEKSTSEIAWFTETVLKFLDIKFQKPYSKVVDLSSGIQFPRWCVDGDLNIVYNCVEKWAENPDTRDNPAVIWEDEEGETRTLSYSELNDEVNRCANALGELGFKKGDAIGIYMPMTPEIVVALFAIAKIGAIILPLFSGYGPQAVAERLNDAGAKGLFTADGFFRRGKVVSLKDPADRAVAEVESIKHVIVLRRAENKIQMKPGRDIWWHDIVSRQSAEAKLEQTSAEDVLMIIYTSGTSGKPKGTVHTHCGFPVKSAQDMAFGTDVHEGDIIYWITDLGWMMGPWLIFGSTILGAACFLYDGAPDYPGPDRLWSMVEKHKINTLGVTPTLIRALIPFGEEPVKKHDLSSLRFFASTSEPWNPDPWMWLFDNVGERKRPIINYSGGTEISGGIVMGNPLLPLKPTAFSGACPGIDADVVDENCKPVRNKVGELIIRSPWIGMTRGFWKDDKRYLDTYWSRWENVWVHGDWAAIDDDGLWYILGRSDDTIKVAGKRVGPAEVESVLVGHPSVSEAAAIGVPHEVKGSEVVCFCVLNKSDINPDDLKEQLRSRVADEMGKPLKPKEIIFVSDLPKTRNGKIMRRVIKKAFLGEDFGDITSLANPESVEEIVKLRK
ncbi:MAG: AMP-binding protein [Candidatus Zixiibacteriota bacterium]|nr:MAG: AMP-binding protein [candidate division Zixibacteria bacterium]